MSACSRQQGRPAMSGRAKGAGGTAAGSTVSDSVGTRVSSRARGAAGGTPADVIASILHTQRQAPAHGASMEEVLPTGDYVLRVRIIEAANLAARDASGTSDPYVVVHVGNAQQRTHVNHKCLACSWGTTMTFELPNLTATRAALMSMRCEVRDADTLSSDLIGSCELELLYVWAHAGHALWHTWLALFSSAAVDGSVVDRTTKGFLRLSAMLIGPGRAPIPPEPPREREAARGVLLSPAVKVQFGTLCLDVLSVTGLQPLGHSRRGPLRAVLVMRWGGLELSTLAARVDDTTQPSEASWESKLRMPVLLPALNDRVDILVLDEATRAVLGTVALSLGAARTVGLGSAKESVYRRVQLYGAVSGSKPAVAEAILRGETPATAWRGSLLLRLYRKRSQRSGARERDDVNALRSAAGYISTMKLSAAPACSPAGPFTLLVKLFAATGVPEERMASSFSVRVQLAHAERATKPAAPVGVRSVEWNEQLALTATIPTELELQPDVFVHLCSSSGAVLAYARIGAAELGQLPPDPGVNDATFVRPRPQWLTLLRVDGSGAALAVPGKSAGADSIELLLETHFGPQRRAPAYDVSGPLPDRPPVLMPAKLKMRLFAANGLPAADASGALDSFVTFRCGGCATKARSAVRAQTTCPGWFEVLALELPLPVDRLLWPSATFELWAADALGGATLVGGATVKMSEVAARVQPRSVDDTAAEPSWYALLEHPTARVSGSERAHSRLEDAPRHAAAPLGALLADFVVEESASAAFYFAQSQERDDARRLRFGDKAVGARGGGLGAALGVRWLDSPREREPLEPPRVPCVLELLVVGLGVSAFSALPQLGGGLRQLELELELQPHHGAPLRVFRRVGVGGAGEHALLSLPCDLPDDPTLCPSLTLRLREMVAGGMLGAGTASTVVASGAAPLRPALAETLRLRALGAEKKGGGAPPKGGAAAAAREPAGAARPIDAALRTMAELNLGLGAARGGGRGHGALSGSFRRARRSGGGSETEGADETELSDAGSAELVAGGADGGAPQAATAVGAKPSDGPAHGQYPHGGGGAAAARTPRGARAPSDDDAQGSAREHGRAAGGAGSDVSGGAAGIGLGTRARARARSEPPLGVRGRVSSLLARRRRPAGGADAPPPATITTPARRDGTAPRRAGSAGVLVNVGEGGEGGKRPLSVSWARGGAAASLSPPSARRSSVSQRSGSSARGARFWEGEAPEPRVASSWARRQKSSLEPVSKGRRRSRPAAALAQLRWATLVSASSAASRRRRHSAEGGGVDGHARPRQRQAHATDADFQSIGELPLGAPAGGGGGGADYAGMGSGRPRRASGPARLRRGRGGGSSGRALSTDGLAAVVGGAALTADGSGSSADDDDAAITESAETEAGAYGPPGEEHAPAMRRADRQRFSVELEEATLPAGGGRLVRPPYSSRALVRAAKGGGGATRHVATLKYTLAVRLREPAGVAGVDARPAADGPGGVGAGAAAAGGGAGGAAAAGPSKQVAEPAGDGFTAVVPLPAVGSSAAAHAGGAPADALGSAPPSLRAPVLIRVYVLSGHQLVPARRQPGARSVGGALQPSAPTGLTSHLVVRHGRSLERRRGRGVSGTFEPLFSQAFEFAAWLPGDGRVRISVVEQGPMQIWDEEIGSTEIDVEDRWFSAEWRRLKLKPVERRPLFRETAAAPQGALELWVDVLTPDEARRLPFRDIPLPKPEEFELRLLLFETRFLRKNNVVRATDAYFRVALRGHDGNEQVQESDVHWAVLDGNARFNWRFVYKIKLPLSTRRSLDGVYLDIQCWDHALMGEGELIAGAQLSVSKLCRDAWLGREWCKDKETGINHESRGRASRGARFWLELSHGGGAAEVDASNAGEVALSLVALPAEVAAKLPAGFGRDPPNRNPVLAEPQRSRSRAMTERFSSIVREEVRGAMKEGAQNVLEAEIARQRRQFTPARLRIMIVLGVLAGTCVLGIIVLQVVANILITVIAWEEDASSASGGGDTRYTSTNVSMGRR